MLEWYHLHNTSMAGLVPKWWLHFSWACNSA